MQLGYIAAEMAEDFREAVRLGVEAGVDTVQLRSRIWGKRLEDLSADDLGRMKEILGEFGMRVGSVYSAVGKCNIEDPNAVAHSIELFPRMADLAHTFDTRVIRVFPYQRPGVQEYEPSHLTEYLDLVVDRLGALVKAAEREGVVICLETVGSTLARTAQELRQVVEALGRPSTVGIIWEIDVAWRAGEPPSAGYRFARGLVRDVHVKPNPELPIVGGGQESYEEAFRSLLADGYDGLVTVEHWETTEATIGALKRLNDLLRKLQ